MDAPGRTLHAGQASCPWRRCIAAAPCWPGAPCCKAACRSWTRMRPSWRAPTPASARSSRRLTRRRAPTAGTASRCLRGWGRTRSASRATACCSPSGRPRPSAAASWPDWTPTWPRPTAGRTSARGSPGGASPTASPTGTTRGWRPATAPCRGRTRRTCPATPCARPRGWWPLPARSRPRAAAPPRSSTCRRPGRGCRRTCRSSCAAPPSSTRCSGPTGRRPPACWRTSSTACPRCSSTASGASPSSAPTPTGGSLATERWSWTRTPTA
mmetsp:Transcript_117878/g.380445  ORF Transcript_117878/g.380445 Transcript_117878/m.380445 type:complete len:269 (-) Transcript_117878:298-1104(-)